MASGDTLVVFTPQANQPPASSYATLDSRNDHPVLDFDAAADESAIFGAVMPRNYSGATGVTVTIVWMATSAVADDAVWEASFERHQADTTDLDGDSFAAINYIVVTTNGTAGAPNYDTITFTDGADMDSVAAGESFRLKISRDADSTNDTDDMAGDAEILRIEIQDT